MHRPNRIAVAALAAGMFVSGCYGPFTLTRKVYRWNGQVSDNKWVVEGVFVICYLIPVYGIATAADAIIFNSVEFWTGKSILDASTTEGASAQRRIVRGATETVLTRVPSPEGYALLIEQSRHGAPGASLRIERRGDATVASDRDGHVLLSARTLPDGRVTIADATGRQVASYTGEQAERFLASLPQK